MLSIKSGGIWVGWFYCNICIPYRGSHHLQCMNNSLKIIHCLEDGKIPLNNTPGRHNVDPFQNNIMKYTLFHLTEYYLIWQNKLTTKKHSNIHLKIRPSNPLFVSKVVADGSSVWRGRSPDYVLNRTMSHKQCYKKWFNSWNLGN